MSKRFIILILAIIAFACACPAQAANDPVAKPKLRVISVAPAVTETIFALGAADCLIATSDFSNFPEAAKKLPSVGPLNAPNIERLLALKPDLVIGTGFENAQLPALLQKQGIRAMDLSMTNFDALFSAILQIGDGVGRADEARKLVDQMKSELAAIAQAHASIPVVKRPRVFVEIWKDPIMTAGGKTYLDELIRAAGGVNVAHEIDKDYPTISAEQVLTWKPDVIILTYMDAPGHGAESLAQRIGWKEIPAVRNGRVIDDLPMDILLRPGPRLPEAVRMLAERLNTIPAAAPGDANRGAAKPEPVGGARP